MNNENMKMQDDKIREFFSESKIKAGENLKYRIMQQIETESAFAAKKSKSKAMMPLIGNTVLVFFVMYMLIILTGVGVYLTGGMEAMNSLTFFVPVIMISLVCSTFWMISVYDDKRRFKQMNQSR